MKYLFLSIIALSLVLASCGPDSGKSGKNRNQGAATGELVPIDAGFLEYITGFTSGVVPANSSIEIRFSSSFASKADKGKLSGLFTFDPQIRGKAEWVDEMTLVFTPSSPLEQGTFYSGSLNLYKIGKVPERLKVFPIRIQTMKKDFTVTFGSPECVGQDGRNYILGGQIATSDQVDDKEVEKYLEARLDGKSVQIKWDHQKGENVHGFTIENIERIDKERELELSWDGTPYGVKQKAASVIRIPVYGAFLVQDVIITPGESQRIDVIMSDVVDPDQDLEGIIWFNPVLETTTQVAGNIITLFPSSQARGDFNMTIESALKSASGRNLGNAFIKVVEFTSVMPGVQATGKGVILPASDNLVFPFRAANLRAVDLRIFKIYENNLPYFLQDNELNERSYFKKFGKPIYYGRIDLVSNPSVNTNKWNLYTLDLSDYITVEPGVLYKIQLGMRRSYSLYPCEGGNPEGNLEKSLDRAAKRILENWENSDSFYDDLDWDYYYGDNFSWNEKDDPCKDSYYSPDKWLVRNVLASNLGLMAKKGPDNILHVFVNDLRTADPVGSTTIELYDLQLQLIGTGSTEQDGTFSYNGDGTPFLIIAKKDKDRNYLKLNEGLSLSLSSFDISGVNPEKGIKGFVYGERDVWRPGDSIFLSLMIRDMTGKLPADHPVQFELYNPMGQRVDNQVEKLNPTGLITFRTKTTDDAVTGAYNAAFSVGGATFYKRVRIETVKPNRLKIDLRFDNEVLSANSLPESGTLTAKWLNGAVAKDLKTSVEAIFRRTTTTFEKYKQYEFDDPSVKYRYETVKVYDGTINSEGKAWISFNPGKDLAAPGMLNAIITARVFEQGGDASIIQKSFKYAPYDNFVGINFPALKNKDRMLFTDANNEMKIVTVDRYGNPVSAKVDVTLYKISYRWWWESDEEDLGYYMSNNSYRPLLNKTLTTNRGEATFSFNVPKNEWGRYLVRVTSSSGHSTGRILLIDWPWEYGVKEGSDGASLLSVSTDKEKYQPGETIKLSFPAPKNSRAIITLENATGIVEQVRVNAEPGNNVVNIKASPGMAPNVYAYVTVIQPHEQTINDMPIRLYGVIPVLVEDSETRLNPVIEAPEEVRSSQPLKVKVTEKSGKLMTYTLAVVDEGLLDITGFKTPDPWSYFYAREALGVKTWDLYNSVLGAFGGTLDRVFAVGGDENAADKSAAKAKRFVPVVRFIGPFTLGAGKTNTHFLTLPQYTGSVKTMVIAGSDKAFGFADKSVFVRDPLMILATAPRVISPGEKVALPVSVFAQKDNIKTVKVEVEGNELISFDQKNQTVSFTEQGEKDLDFSFTVAEKTGKATIKVTATSNGEKAEYIINIEVRLPNPPEVRTELKVLKPGEKALFSFVPFGIEGTREAKADISGLPSINLTGRLSYLVHYPHGCSEQITSAAFPQLWIGDIVPDDPDLVKFSNSNVLSAIHMLGSRQMNNGGIMLWPGSSQPDSWVTSYAGHFLAEAEKKGFNIPSGFKNRWASYQRNAAREWRFDSNFKYSANDQAYRLFSLAAWGQPERGAMNRLRETPDIPQLAKWLLAASFALTGKDEAAYSLIDVRNLRTDPNDWEYYYGGNVRDQSIVLYTLAVLGKTEEALPLLKEICDGLSGYGWYSTQSVSWGLLSYMKYSSIISGGQNGPLKAQVTVNGQKKDINLKQGKVFSFPVTLKPDANNISVENTSQSALYVSLTQKGVPLRNDATRDEKGMTMTVDYLSATGKTPLDQKVLKQGTDFLMVVKVTNTSSRWMKNIALTQMVPSGWEIRNTRLYDTEGSIKESDYDYRDIRDDRVHTYFSISPGRTLTYILYLNASYKGEYFQPAVLCEAMYAGDFYSRIPGNIVKVTGEDN